ERGVSAPFGFAAPLAAGTAGLLGGIDCDADLPPSDALCASSSPACGGGEEDAPLTLSLASGSTSDASTPANSATRRVSELNSMALRKAISRLWSGSWTARSPIGT